MFQRGLRLFAFGAFAMVCSVRVAHSQTMVTWGGGFPDDNLTTASNWIGGVAPLNDGSEDLIFPSESSNFLNLDVTGKFHAVISGDDDDGFSSNVISGGSLQIGNGGIYVNSEEGSNSLTINSSVILEAAQSWGVGEEGGSLTINGAITGTQPILFAGDGFQVTLTLTNPASTFGDASNGLTVTGNEGTVLFLGASSVGGSPGAPASGPVGVGPLTLGFDTTLGTTTSSPVTIANNIIIANGDDDASVVTFGQPEDFQDAIRSTNLTLTGSVTASTIDTALEFRPNTQVTFAGPLTGPLGTRFEFFGDEDGTSEAILQGSFSNIASIGIDGSMSVILDGSYSTQVARLTDGIFFDDGQSYIGLGKNYNGDVANFINFVGPGGFEGTLGFDTTSGATANFTETIDLANFDTEFFVGLGSATKAILSGTIIPPGGFGESTTYPFGGGGGTLTVTSPLVDGMDVEHDPLSNNLQLLPGNAPLTLVLSGPGVAAYTGNTYVDGAALIFDTAVPSNGIGSIQIGEFESPGYVGTTTASGILDTTPNPLAPLLSQIDSESSGVVGFDDLTGGTRLIQGDINLIGHPEIYLGTTTKVTYSGNITPSNGTFQFSGVKGGQVTVTSPSLTGVNSVTIGLPDPIESFGSVSSVSLPGDNYYSGGTVLNSGYLYVGTSNSLGQAGLSVESDGATVGLAPIGGVDVFVPNAISIGDGNLHLNTPTSGHTLTLGGPINGFGSLTIDGAVVINGSNSEIQTTTVSAGAVLTLNDDESLGGGYLLGSTGSTTNFNSDCPDVDGMLLTGATVTFASGSSPLIGELSMAEGSHLSFLGSSEPEIDQLDSDTPGSGNTISIGSGTTLFFDLAEDPDFYGTITGAGSVDLESGMLNLAGANTYTGGTTVGEFGTLIVSNNSALGTSPVQVSGTLGVNKATTITNAITLADGGVLAGFGTFSPGGTIIFQNGSRLVPGIVNLDTNNNNGSIPTIGQLSFGGGTSVTLAPGGHFSFGISDATGAAGVGYDTASVAGNLDITATFGNTFCVDLYSLAPATAETFSTCAINFDSSQNYSWTLLSAGSISGFAPTAFLINQSGFLNNTGVGQFSISQSGNDILLNFSPVPEPSTWALMGTGLIAVGLIVRRRKVAGA
jgi:hypothetical protein